MWRSIVRIGIGCCLAGLALCADRGAARAAAEEPKVLIPFDFQSSGERGDALGPQLADMVWKKIDRLKGKGPVISLEALQDCRDLCQSKGYKLSADTPLTTVKKIVSDDFSAQIGVWGSVHLAPGQENEIYDLTIKCYDFSAVPPKKIYECKVRTQSAAEIPHKYVKELLDAVLDRPADGGPTVDPAAEARWEDPRNLNLVKGGDFEYGRGGVPNGWETKGGHVREPLGRQVQWLADTSNPQNKVIRLNLDKATGDSTGNFYYSLPFPVEAGSTYRFQCRYRSNGPAVKVFIKCYDRMATEFKPDDNAAPVAARARTDAKPRGGRDYVGEVMQDREVYRAQMQLKGPKNQWNTHSEDFTPKHTKYTPRTGRVDLFCYLGAGVVEFDDVVIKKIIQGSASDVVKPSERRHSLETKVTLKEMEENQRRSDERKRAPQTPSTPLRKEQ